GEYGTCFAPPGAISLSPLWKRAEFRTCRQNTMQESTDRGLGLPAGFYHFAFEAGSEAALADKRDELRTKGIDVTNILDHGGSKSIYFKDPNGLSLEYCCALRNLTKDDATMRER